MYISSKSLLRVSSRLSGGGFRFLKPIRSGIYMLLFKTPWVGQILIYIYSKLETLKWVQLLKLEFPMMISNLRTYCQYENKKYLIGFPYRM